MRELIEYNRKNNMLLQKNTLQEVDERLRRSMNINFNTIDSGENGRTKWRIEHNGLQIRYIWIIKKK